MKVLMKISSAERKRVLVLQAVQKFGYISYIPQFVII